MLQALFVAGPIANDDGDDNNICPFISMITLPGEDELLRSHLRKSLSR